MVDRIRYPTVSYLPFYYVFFQFLLLTIFNLQANILTTKDILSNLDWRYTTRYTFPSTVGTDGNCRSISSAAHRRRLARGHPTSAATCETSREEGGGGGRWWCIVTTDENEKKMKNVYFQTHRSFYIIFSLKVLNRYQRFIHSVGGFKKPIYRYTNQAICGVEHRLLGRKMNILGMSAIGSNHMWGIIENWWIKLQWVCGICVVICKGDCVMICKGMMTIVDLGIHLHSSFPA